MAVFLHENWRLLSYTFCDKLFFRSSLFSRVTKAFSNSFLLKGLINIQASPVTSGIEVMLEVITGVLQLMDSNGGSPKPSYRDG